MNTKLIGGTLLVAGLCIGAGMLALPVITESTSLLTILALFILCWASMCYAAYLILEVNLWLEPGANYVSMAKETLGSWGQAIVWVLYLLLLYSLLAAYITGGGALFNHALGTILGHSIFHWIGPVIVVFLVSLLIYAGTKFSDYVNRIFIVGLAISFALLMTLLIPAASIAPVLFGHTGHHVLSMLPVVITAFGFQIIVPSLYFYSKGDLKLLKKNILLGSLLALVTYIIWVLLIRLVIPASGPNGLHNILQNSDVTTGLVNSLSGLAERSWLNWLFEFFSFFAIGSSLIGAALSLFHFLEDGFKIRPTITGKFLALLLAFLPPLGFAFLYPRGFIMALAYAGVIVALLMALAPIFMVWFGRRARRKAGKPVGYQVWGGNWILVLIALFALLIIYAQFFQPALG